MMSPPDPEPLPPPLPPHPINSMVNVVATTCIAIRFALISIANLL
jgi:hypothetical protein